MESTINGYFKLSWRERIGYCSGDLAQNLIYQTVSIWLLLYYNNVYGLDSAVVAVMFLVVRIIDVLWDPMVGAFVDKSYPRWGKYRSWLIEDVDRTEFGTHLDVVNMITSPRRYFYNDEFLRECFQKLHGTIVSCHLKDIMLKQEYTFQLQECACGEGSLDIELYAQLATAENPGMPMIIEHLADDKEYVDSVRYVQKRLYKEKYSSD